MLLFHGTSSIHDAPIAATGLNSPCLTSSLALAVYYADTVALDDGGEALVYQVEVKPSCLRYDRPSMDEPVGFGGRNSHTIALKVEKALERAALRHPDWVKGGYLSVPETEYALSLRAAGSCRVAGTVAPGKVKRVSYFRDPFGSFRLSTPENFDAPRWQGPAPLWYH
jgi:hypothetical protein